MSTTEALDILIAADPSRTWSAHKTTQDTAHDDGTRTRNFEYQIFAQPGFKTANCDLIDNKHGFDQPVAEYLALIHPTPATPNNE